MEETFEEYLKQARCDFAIVAEKYSEDLELRTAIDSFLIAYDQAVDKALRTPDAAGQSEQLVCPICSSIHNVSNCGGAIPYDSLSDSLKKSIDSIEDGLNK